MKPLNLDNSPCSPISSNCVIWQGPDIPCIKLCKGDTVSDVVYKLGIELCNIMDLLDVNGYDLSCFDLASCKPKDIQELIQFLIERICALENINKEQSTGPITTTTNLRTATAETLVTVAPCFIVGTTTVMTIAEYAQAMGTKICSIIDQISTINLQINDLDIRVTTLENTPAPTFTIPSFTLACNINSLISGSTHGIDVILQQYINNVWCGFYSITGSTTNLTNAVASQCIVGTDYTKVNPAATYAMQYSNFIQPASTIADILNNLWIVLCDIYNGSVVTVTGATTSTIKTTVTGGPAYTVSSKLLDTGWVDLNGFGYYSGTDTLALKPQARRIGNIVHFRGLITIPIDDGTGAPLLWQYQSSPSIDTYYLSNTVAPASVGPGSVLTSTSGTVTFNQGNSIIPTSIMGNSETFDSNYSLTFVVGTRPVQIDNSPVTSTILTGLFNISISNTKILSLSLPKNAEQNAFSGTGAFNTSHLNYIISHVRSGEYVPKFDNAVTNVNSNVAAGTIALNMKYDSTLTYPFSCNANDEQQVGGFRIQLDGLTAYIDPCTTDIPTPIVCP
jgi:hypothetical protein